MILLVWPSFLVDDCSGIFNVGNMQTGSAIYVSLLERSRHQIHYPRLGGSIEGKKNPFHDIGILGILC